MDGLETTSKLVYNLGPKQHYLPSYSSSFWPQGGKTSVASKRIVDGFFQDTTTPAENLFAKITHLNWQARRVDGTGLCHSNREQCQDLPG